MSETYQLRKKLIDIARRDRGLAEVTKNRAPWIEKLWPTTSSPEFYHKGNRDYPNGDPPYCAAGVCYCVHEWLMNEDVRRAFGFAAFKQADKWRCKSAGAFEWINWAREHSLQVLNPHAILHMGDLVVYSHSHIEIVVDDDGTTEGSFIAIGYNTNASGARDGEGCFEKPRQRAGVKAFIRMLP